MVVADMATFQVEEDIERVDIVAFQAQVGIGDRAAEELMDIVGLVGSFEDDSWVAIHQLICRDTWKMHWAW